jgi:hypothetical protein
MKPACSTSNAGRNNFPISRAWSRGRVYEFQFSRPWNRCHQQDRSAAKTEIRTPDPSAVRAGIREVISACLAMFAVTLSLGPLAGPSPAQTASDEGVSRHIPWSGYWWPIAKGELLVPLGKYDVLTGRRAAWWELENHPPGPLASPWHGYCHGWAAASVLEREPQQARQARSSGGTSSPILDVADQKGWYSACHAYDSANQYGDRFGDGEGSEDMQDMAPDMLWQLLRLFIREHRLPLVMDMDPGPEVWNYPVYAYRVDYQSLGRGDGWCSGQLQLCAADDAVPPGYVGTVPHVQGYTFVFQMRDGALVLGSGRWTGQSYWVHPDFAWYPYVAVPENPELAYDAVKGLIQGAPRPASSARPQTPAVGSVATPQVPAARPGAAPLSAADWLGHGAVTVDHAGQPRPRPLSPLQLVAAIANQTSQFGLDAYVEPFGKTRYQVGQRTAVFGSSDRAGYLYVLHVAPTGELDLVYPAPGVDNRVTGKGTFRVPPAGQGDYGIRGPFGNHRIKVLVTERPLILTGLDRRGPLGAEGESPRDGSGVQVAAGAPQTWLGYGFRFNPSQERQMMSLLQDFLQGKTLTPDRLDQIDVHRLLSGFAQDEITYYVGPNDEP